MWVKKLTLEGSTIQAAGWSGEMDAAHAAYGSTAKVKIIRQLRVGGPMTRSEIAGHTAIGHGLVAQCVNRLKSLGVVTDAVQLPGCERRFALDELRADQLLRALTTYVTAGNADLVHTSCADALSPGHSPV